MLTPKGSRAVDGESAVRGEKDADCFVPDSSDAGFVTVNDKCMEGDSMAEVEKRRLLRRRSPSPTESVWPPGFDGLRDLAIVGEGPFMRAVMAVDFLTGDQGDQASTMACVLGRGRAASCDRTLRGSRRLLCGADTAKTSLGSGVPADSAPVAL